mgnify:CR=1 FL=1
MKIITAIIRPEKLPDVLEALFKADVRGLTISRVQGSRHPKDEQCYQQSFSDAFHKQLSLDSRQAHAAVHEQIHAGNVTAPVGAKQQRRADALAIVRKMEADTRRSSQGNFLVAVVYAALGDRDAALRAAAADAALPPDLPAQRVRPPSGRVTWMLDPAAAALLEPAEPAPAGWLRPAPSSTTRPALSRKPSMPMLVTMKRGVSPCGPTSALPMTRRSRLQLSSVR